MPLRDDIKKIMVIGSGPIVIGQAAEFDFSGSQACRSLREEGYKTVLVNSNPATIQTDPDSADAVYIEPLTIPSIVRIIEKEKVDGIMSGMGGQTALNICAELADKGLLEKLGVELLGTQPKAIALSEDRDLFRQTMIDLGEPIPRSISVNSIEAAYEAVEKIGGYPVLIRPAYTLGGTGGGIAYTKEDLGPIAGRGIAYSRIKQVLIEESVLGWKEFEYEVMRDKNNNCITVCNMENLDPMGIHTGESIVVAPAQTLSDNDHQMLRSASLKIIRALGIEGGCNIQFALKHETAEYRVIEVNPRVSRSSALASKATGYPIARVAAKIAVGKTLDEITNAITGKTCAAFEPSIDYIVTKIPRWPFDKFKTVDRKLGTQMKSTGEVMSIGRCFEESLLKAIRSLEIDQVGLESEEWNEQALEEELRAPTDRRLYAIAESIRMGRPNEWICERTKWDPFFVQKIRNIIAIEKELKEGYLSPELLARAKKIGYSDEYLSLITKESETQIRKQRKSLKIAPVYKMVDTCAAEFEAETPYFYSTYESECESRPSKNRKVVIVGGGPIRIGQGIEFDYCCVHAAFALREIGYETIMVNSNPETVSTDYDTSDKLYFEPLTREDVLAIVDREKPDGVIVQLGGQTPLTLAVGLEAAGVKIIGTSPDSIDRAEDRRRFAELVRKLGLRQPENGTAVNEREALAVAQKIGYPVLVRPSYVLGGRAMEIVYDDASLAHYMERAVWAAPDRPVLVDRFIEDAIEVDVDMVSDGKVSVIGGIMEHIEEAGVHSGDAAMVLPAHTLPHWMLEEIRRYTRLLAAELGVVGLMNVQYAVQGKELYIIEVNPRASRTVPFVSKAIGVPLAKVAAKTMVGMSLAEIGFTEEITPRHISVKESVLPFARFPGVDIILGPEMKSTGEVMGIDSDFGRAYCKSQLGALQDLPESGTVFISLKNEDKTQLAVSVAHQLATLGFSIISTAGTAAYFRENGIAAEVVRRVSEGSPELLDRIRSGRIQLIINTPSGKGPRTDEVSIRAMANGRGIPVVTTMPGADAYAQGIRALIRDELTVTPIQRYHEVLRKVPTGVSRPSNG